MIDKAKKPKRYKNPIPSFDRCVMLLHASGNSLELANDVAVNLQSMVLQGYAQQEKIQNWNLITITDAGARQARMLRNKWAREIALGHLYRKESDY